MLWSRLRVLHNIQITVLIHVQNLLLFRLYTLQRPKHDAWREFGCLGLRRFVCLWIHGILDTIIYTLLLSSNEFYCSKTCLVIFQVEWLLKHRWILGNTRCVGSTWNHTRICSDYDRCWCFLYRKLSIYRRWILDSVLLWILIGFLLNSNTFDTHFHHVLWLIGFIITLSESCFNLRTRIVGQIIWFLIISVVIAQVHRNLPFRGLFCFWQARLTFCVLSMLE